MEIVLRQGCNECCYCGSIIENNASIKEVEQCGHLMCINCVNTWRERARYLMPVRRVTPCLLANCCNTTNNFHEEYKAPPININFKKCGICANVILKTDSQSQIRLPFIMHRKGDDDRYCKISYCVSCISKYAAYYIIKNRLLPLCTNETLPLVIKSIQCPKIQPNQINCAFPLFLDGDNNLADITELKSYIPLCLYNSSSKDWCHNCGVNDANSIELDYCRHRICISCLSKKIKDYNNSVVAISCPVANCCGVLSLCDKTAFKSKGIKFNTLSDYSKCNCCGINKPFTVHACKFGMCVDCIIKYFGFLRIVNNYHLCRIDFHCVLYNKGIMRCLYCDQSYDDTDIAQMTKILMDNIKLKLNIYTPPQVTNSMH